MVSCDPHCSSYYPAVERMLWKLRLGRLISVAASFIFDVCPSVGESCLALHNITPTAVDSSQRRLQTWIINITSQILSSDDSILVRISLTSMARRDGSRHQYKRMRQPPLLSIHYHNQTNLVKRSIVPSSTFYTVHLSLPNIDKIENDVLGYHRRDARHRRKLP